VKKQRERRKHVGMEYGIGGNSVSKENMVRRAGDRKAAARSAAALVGRTSY